MALRPRLSFEELRHTSETRHAIPAGRAMRVEAGPGEAARRALRAVTIPMSAASVLLDGRNGREQEGAVVPRTPLSGPHDAFSVLS